MMMKPDPFCEIHTVVQDLPTTIRGFVCLGPDFEPVIVINARMTEEQQRRTYLHELRHIRSGEMDDPDYREYG